MAVTPNYSWPVPVNTDLVKDGAEAIKDLGDAIDSTVFGLPSGALALVKSQVIGTGVASVTVSGAFSATYDNYKIIINGGVASTLLILNLKLGASAASYDYAQASMTYASGSLGNNGNAVNASSFIAGAGSGTTTLLNGILEMQNPFLTKPTNIQSNWVYNQTNPNLYFGTHQVSTSYTDFTVTPSTGTITGGTIRVYGYQN